MLQVDVETLGLCFARLDTGVQGNRKRREISREAPKTPAHKVVGLEHIALKKRFLKTKDLQVFAHSQSNDHCGQYLSYLPEEQK